MALKAFGKRLAQLRREKAYRDEVDLDRRDVAKAVQASPSSITRWEGGEVWPNEDTLEALAKYFGVTKGWLRYGEGPREATLPPGVGELRPRPGTSGGSSGKGRKHG